MAVNLIVIPQDMYTFQVLEALHYNAVIQDLRLEMSVSPPTETPPTDVTLLVSFSSFIVSFAGPSILCDPGKLSVSVFFRTNDRCFQSNPFYVSRDNWNCKVMINRIPVSRRPGDQPTWIIRQGVHCCVVESCQLKCCN